MGYPKEYEVWVCPPSGQDEIYPVYDCEDRSVHVEPGQCPACGKQLAKTGVADTDFYLATYELMA